MGRITESIWSRNGNAAHPKTWTRRSDVKPGLLLRLRTPNIDGERCPITPVPDSTPARPAQTALSALQAQLEQRWTAQVKHSIRSGASAEVQQQHGLGRNARARRTMAEAAVNSASAVALALQCTLGIRPGTRTRRSLVQRTDEVIANSNNVTSLPSTGNVTIIDRFALVAAMQPDWTPRDSSCPLFARKFDAATAGAVARAYATAVLPAASTHTAEHVMT